MKETVLFVDDEEYVLNAAARVFEDSGLHIVKTGTGEEALEIIRREPIAVLVSDNMMPGITGMELLQLVKTISPDTVKILMTAFSDLPTTIEAINRGEVFRFVVKPWDNQELLASVNDGIGRYRLSQALHRDDEAVLHSLAQTIELKDPFTRGHCERVAQYALMLAEALRIPAETLKEIRHGSWLHDCGKIGVPEVILNCSGKLSDKDFVSIRQHPIWGTDVARHANLPPSVLNIILYHHEYYNGNGYPTGIAGRDIPLEARIVTIADVYDALTTARPYRPAHTAEHALEIMVSMIGNILDPELTELFFFLLKGGAADNQAVNCRQSESDTGERPND